MVRKVLGVIAGYVAMSAFVFATFSLLYLILGAEGSFEPGSYTVSTTWIAASIILSIIAALLGGIVCVAIAKDKKIAYVLAGIVFVLGMILAVPVLTETGDEMVREGSVSNMEAMQNAKQPPFAALLNPIIGAAGVVIGASLLKTKKEQA